MLKIFFSSVFAKSPATKSLCSDHGNKPCPWDDWRLVLDHEKTKQALHLHSAGQIICAESRAGTANYVRKRSSCWDRCIQEKKCYAAILYSVSKERQLVVQPRHEQFSFCCLFLHGHWNVSWGPHGAEHTVWLQDVTGGAIGTIMHPGATDFHLALLHYFSQMKSPSQGFLLSQAGPAPNWIRTLSEVRVSLLLSLGLSLVICCCQKRLVKACWGGSTKLMAIPRL